MNLVLLCIYLSICLYVRHFLFLWCLFSGITAEDPSGVHYQLKNSSVCLHVRSPPPYSQALWRLDGTVIASSEKMNPTFAEKVDYNPGNHSLCIKELTDKDNGIYIFSFTDSNFSLKSEEHKLIVQGRFYSSFTLDCGWFYMFSEYNIYFWI